MATKRAAKSAAKTKGTKAAAGAFDVPAIVAALEQAGSKQVRDGYPRFGIVAKNAFGVPMAKIQALGKRVGVRHHLVDELWDTGVYEARLLCAFVADAEQVTKAQMQRWCDDFDNWGVVDTVCFKLWDRSPHAFAMVDAWAKEAGEYQLRASPVLLACLALHDRAAADALFVKRLPLLAGMATDDRNFVKKGVLWAINALARRGPVVRRELGKLCERLAGSDDKTAQWLGRSGTKALAK